MAAHSSTLAWKIPGMGEPGGCCLRGRTELNTTEVTWQQRQQQQQQHPLYARIPSPLSIHLSMNI